MIDINKLPLTEFNAYMVLVTQCLKRIDGSKPEDLYNNNNHISIDDLINAGYSMIDASNIMKSLEKKGLIFLFYNESCLIDDHWMQLGPIWNEVIAFGKCNICNGPLRIINVVH